MFNNTITGCMPCLILTLGETVQFTEEGAQHPALGEVVDEVNPRARQRHQQVADGQVDDVVVGG